MKNTTIGPLAGIKPAALQSRYSTLTNWATARRRISWRALITSSCISAYIYILKWCQCKVHLSISGFWASTWKFLPDPLRPRIVYGHSKYIPPHSSPPSQLIMIALRRSKFYPIRTPSDHLRDTIKTLFWEFLFQIRQINSDNKTLKWNHFTNSLMMTKGLIWKKNHRHCIVISFVFFFMNYLVFNII